jgi:hypothetical protein
MELLHAVLMKAGTFLETEITDLMQAIEAYCSFTNPFCYLPEDKFNSALSRMLGVIVEEDTPFRDRVKGTIKHLNRPSSRSHLKALFERLDSKIAENVTGGERSRKFIDRAVDIRNTIVHPQSGSIWTDYNSDQILKLISQLKLLLIVSLLGDAGMPIEILQTRYKDYHQWQWG